MPDQTTIAQLRIDEIIASADSLDAEGVAAALELLDQTRRHIIATIHDASTDYGRLRVDEALSAVDRIAFEFRTRYSAQVAALQSRAWNLGILSVDAPLSAVSSTHLGQVVSQQLLEVAQGFSADLIRGLAADIREAVSVEIRLGSLAGRSPFEIMQRIGSKIDKGRFASVAQRAEVITRTETNRVLSIASNIRMAQAKGRMPGLRQQWVATLDERTRPGHRAANDQVQDIGATFDVDGEELRFPGDPKGSPGNTINCRCKVVPYAASWTDVVAQAGAALIAA